MKGRQRIGLSCAPGILLGMVLALWSAGTVAGQDRPLPMETPVRVVLSDGSVLVGTVEAANEEVLYFRTASGLEVTVPRDRVVGVEPLQGAIVLGRYLRADPNRTRLFFSPTARRQGSGRGYVALYEIFFPYVSVGFGHTAQAGLGVSLIPGASDQVLYAGAKLTVVERPSAALAAGGFALTITGGEGSGGILFAVGTFGPPHAAVTTGVGFAFGGGEFAETPALLVGGEYQLSNNVKLLSENIIIPNVKDAILLSGGIRFFGERLASDFGLLTAPAAFEEGGFPFVPWVGLAYNFGV